MPLVNSTSFQPFGVSHNVVLTLSAVIAVVFVILGRRWRHADNDHAETCSRALAGLLLVVAGGLQVYSMLPAHWDLGTSLPFQLCDLAWMVAVHALWTRRQWSFGLLYFWGLTLTSQALVTPQLEHDFPHPQFIMFWSSHCLVVLAAIYLTWGLGLRPRWGDFGRAASVTTGWILLMLLFNCMAGTNYLYVNRKPESASILDLLGDWPVYVVVEVGLALGLWAAITLPWTLGHNSRSDGELTKNSRD